MIVNNPKGSVWNRWEPHIHIPGTVLNDQFAKGEFALSDFCERIEKSEPAIKALGITDYYTTISYEKTIAIKKTGRLSNVEIIFPNVELRLKIATDSDKAINGHLIFSPDDPNHVQEIKRFLQKLTFKTGKDVYQCEENDLVKLGTDHDPSIVDNKKALETGTNQFKVDFDQLIQNIKESTWAQNNLLIAVAGGSKDGVAGLNKDSSFSSTRQAIERSSHIIFSSSAKQREYWVGKGVLTRAQIIAKYNNCKPCIHGSDAHTNSSVGVPTEQMYTWIKGDLIFESLKQICIEPEDRVLVAPQPPVNRTGSNVITQLNVSNADWMKPSLIPLNTGLITVIGARGSGKTALADMIATGGFAISEQLSDTSFIKRAYNYLTEVEVQLDWTVGSSTKQEVHNTDWEGIMDYPRVQYLSQKFVDQLCSSEGMTDRLILEIEKVIFNAHPYEDRLGITHFQELLAQKAFSARAERQNQESIIQQLSELITIERAKHFTSPVLQKKSEDLTKEINTDKTSRDKLLVNDKDQRMKNLADITSAFDTVKLKLESAQNKLRLLNSLKQNISSARTTTFPTYTDQLKTSHTGIDFTKQEWELFNINFTGNIDNLFTKKLAAANAEITIIKGTKVVIAPNRKVEETFIPLGAKPEDQSYEVLSQEIERLKKVIGIDTENAKQYSRISDRILKSQGELDKLIIQISNATNAKGRIIEHSKKRKLAYQQAFEAILSEEEELKKLYQPLMTDLKSKEGSLGKLSFVVRREADIQNWAQRGENLLNLRKSGPFKGKGALHDAVSKELKSAWETGTATEISEALASFRENHEKGILEHAQPDRKDLTQFSNWQNQVAEWLYSTNHITINYGVIYDNVDIQLLSPGTRGIVLLLLYLAIDKEDERPLIIDQPEENLDPKSIFDELVPPFKDAKKRRQIIIVTHNANLVVNTDADQVIVASAGLHQSGKLPEITYYCGGLENPEVRR